MAFAPYLHFALFLFVAALQASKRRWADLAWTAAALGLPMTTGTSAGIPRYLMTVYPAHFALAEFSENRPVLRRVWLGIYAAILLLNTALFVNWHFVS